MRTFTATGYICERCEKRWIPRRLNRIPVICPFCKSRKWSIKK